MSLRCALLVALPVLSVPAGLAYATTPMPAHVYAPYFETSGARSITTTAQRSGTRYFTLAFLQSLGRSSCTLAWNGARKETLASGRFLSDIASLRALGGDVFPSFGGQAAGEDGTEIADSCTNVTTLAAAYKSVILTYNVTRLDMDVEGKSLTRAAGIDRRNKALKIVEAWAAAKGRPLQISYTLPTRPTGLEPLSVAVLKNAVANGTRVDVVNIMSFDYYDGVTTDMGGAAIRAAKGLFQQLKRLYPAKSAAGLWAMEGNTILPGIDDNPKKTEVTRLSDAKRLLDFARSVGINSLSIWAIQRDNGDCPGKPDANTCSGIAQSPWAFSHLLERFTK